MTPEQYKKLEREVERDEAAWREWQEEVKRVSEICGNPYHPEFWMIRYPDLPTR